MFASEEEKKNSLLDQSLCLDTSQISFSNYSLSDSIGFAIVLRRCVTKKKPISSVWNRTVVEVEDECYNDEEFSKYLSQGLTLLTFEPENYVDFTDYENPVKTAIVSTFQNVIDPTKNLSRTGRLQLS